MTKSELEELVLGLQERIAFIEACLGSVDEIPDDDEVDYSPDKAADAASAVISFADWETTYEGKEYWSDVYNRLIEYAEDE